MTSALTAFGNESRSTKASHQLCHSDRCHNRDDFNPGGKPIFDIAGWISCASGDDLDLFLQDNLSNLICKGTQQHDIHANRFIGDSSCNPNLFPHKLARCISGSNNAKTAAVGNGSGQFTVSDPSHAPLKDRIFDPQKITNL